MFVYLTVTQIVRIVRYFMHWKHLQGIRTFNCVRVAYMLPVCIEPPPPPPPPLIEKHVVFDETDSYYIFPFSEE